MMKKIIASLVIVLLVKSTIAQGYQVRFQVSGFNSGIVYLTYYMGANYDVEDSAAFDNTGTAVFKGKNKLPGGIYVIVFDDKKKTVEFLLDKEQNIQIKADPADLLNKTEITGSKDNLLYKQYQQFVGIKGKLMNAERTAYMASVTKADSTLHEKKYNAYNKELQAYRETLIKNNPDAMLTALLKAMKEPTVPKANPVTHQDTLSNYTYYKTHYWDGVTFMDDRIIRSPFFIKKLERYYDEVLEQEPELIIKDIDYKLLLARTSPEMYKFLLNWYTDQYISPKYMGGDAVFVHLFEKYHSKGLSKWLNTKQMDAISRRAYMVMDNLIGVKAAELNLVDTSGKPSPLYDLVADYTIVTFWDPNCGHCKEEIPRLDSIYNASWKQHGVKIYAVLTPEKGPDAVKAEWTKFIREKNLGEWTNVYQTAQMENEERTAQKTSFRQSYDVQSTPTVFLLDKDKHIIGKKLTLFQLNDLLEVKWKKTSSH